MAIVHTWSINPELLTKDQGSNSNVVYSVLWRLASKETVGDVLYETSSSNQINLNTNNISNFTAFNDLTEDQVLGWVKDKIDEDANLTKGLSCNQWEAAHERKIEKEKNPPTRIQAAPWSVEERS